jgi:hypothetical protein
MQSGSCRELALTEYGNAMRRLPDVTNGLRQGCSAVSLLCTGTNELGRVVCKLCTTLRSCRNEA